MDPTIARDAVIRHYPRIYFACHQRHVRDPGTLETLLAHAVSVLDHLDAVEPTFVSALASHMGVTASTMSLALDRLQAGGYVRRERDGRDARRVGVVLTESGERIRRASSVLDPDLVMALVERLGEADRERAIVGLALLADAAMNMRSGPRVSDGSGAPATPEREAPGVVPAGESAAESRGAGGASKRMTGDGGARAGEGGRP